MVLEREPNNTVATAHNLGAISRTGVSTPRTSKIEGSVGTGNPDIFRFLTGNPATCEIKLTLSGADGIISLYRDANRNGQLEDSEVIISNSLSGAKTITLEGAASELDEFHARVTKGGAAANYSLDITVTPKVARESEPNNVASQAKDIGQLNGARRYESSVHNSNDRTDFYGFRIGATRNVSINLSDPNFSTANTDLRLYRDANNNKQIEASEFVVASTGAKSQENISRQLGAGNYFVEVVSLSGSVNYGLNMTARA
jgi:hypothetical protein